MMMYLLYVHFIFHFHQGNMATSIPMGPINPNAGGDSPTPLVNQSSQVTAASQAPQAPNQDQATSSVTPIESVVQGWFQRIK
jgi:hypothetical protein